MEKNNSFVKKIRKVIFKIAKNKKINIKKINFSENFDSLQLLDFVEEIEKFFKIKISEKDINYKNFSSLKNLKKIIKKNEKA
jgi:acyl carrier protein